MDRPTRIVKPVFFPVALLVLLAFHIVRSTISCKLRKIPGPWYTCCTNIVLKWHVVTGNRVPYVHGLHQRYGKIVRLSPNEVSVSGHEDIKLIYGIATAFPKANWYQDMVDGHGPPGVFGTIDNAAHARRRKILAGGFTKTQVLKWEPQITDRVNLAVNRIKNAAAEPDGADLWFWFLVMAADVMGLLSCGETFNMLERGEKNAFLHNLELVMISGGLRVEFPLFHRFAMSIPNKRIRDIVNPLPYVREEGLAMIARHRANAIAEKAKLKEKTRFDDDRFIFSKMLAEDSPFAPQTVADEIGNLCTAATDTVASTLSYLIYQVLTNPDVHARLVAEIATLPPNYVLADVAKLRYLEAVYKESTRLFGAAISGLFRQVPSGGRLFAGGHWLPEKTVVSAQSFTTQRDPTIFENPEVFDPERWLNGSLPKAAETAYAPFGRGTRICLGVHQAETQIFLVIAAFFSPTTTPLNQQTTGVPQLSRWRMHSRTTPKVMEPRFDFLTKPRGGSTWVTLT